MIEDDDGLVMNWSLDNELRWVVEDYVEDVRDMILFRPMSRSYAGWALMLMPASKYREAPDQ